MKLYGEKYQLLLSNVSSFLSNDMRRGTWMLEDKVRDRLPAGVSTIIYMLSNNVTGRPASKKSYHASAVMDDGHETDKPQR